MLSLEQGKRLIKLARDSITAHFSKKGVKVSKEIKGEFSSNMGAFVTLNIGEQLRGCIGFPEAIYPLHEAVVKAATSAAFSDPRFMPLSEEEFKYVKIEVSVLT